MGSEKKRKSWCEIFAIKCETEAIASLRFEAKKMLSETGAP
jgi:hypothetical protein